MFRSFTMMKITLLAVFGLLLAAGPQDSKARSLYDRGLKAQGKNNYKRAIVLYDRTADTVSLDEIEKIQI